MQKKNENLKTAVIVVTLLFILFITILSLYKLGKSKNEPKEIDNKIIQEDETTEDLGEYFDKEFSEEEVPSGSDVFLLNDPFAETCAGTSGDNLPSITSNTVCFR